MDTNIKETFIKNLDYLMRERGAKASDMEAAAEISAGYISRLKNSSSFPSVEVLISFADSLGVTINSLLYGNYSMSSNDELFVVSFLEKLLTDTTNETIHWTKLSMRESLPASDSKSLSKIYGETTDNYGNWVGDYYNSLFFEEKCELRSNILKLDRVFQTFYILPIKKHESGTIFTQIKTVDGFEMYVFRDNKINKVTAALANDSSATYNLILSIYVAAVEISKKLKLGTEAKKAIDEYISGKDDELPF